MAAKQTSGTRVQWLERRISRRNALKGGAAGTAAAAALWMTPSVRTVKAFENGPIATPPPVVCRLVWEGFGRNSPNLHGTLISSLSNIMLVRAKRRASDGTHESTWRPAMVFNTEFPTGGNFGGDEDLRTDGSSIGVNNDGVGGAPVGGAQLGNVLIIQENYNADGSPGVPDDNAHGGIIEFTFKCPVRVDSIDVLDVEVEETGGNVCLLKTAGGGTTAVGINGLGNNSLKHIELGGVQDVVTMTVKFTGSGAVAQFCYCVPEGCDD